MHTSNSHKQKFQDNNEVKAALEIKTENVEKSTFVKLKSENICNGELNNSPAAVQIKTENVNMQNESAQIDELILGV